MNTEIKTANSLSARALAVAFIIIAGLGCGDTKAAEGTFEPAAVDGGAAVDTARSRGYVYEPSAEDLSAAAGYQVDLKDLLRAIAETEDESVRYVSDYVRIPYPMGDVPEGTGVCTDVIIRVYRKVGIDLQKELHEDIRANFGRYPSRRIWGLSAPDRNIDHRRVPNLMTFFSRHGKVMPITDRREDYKPGDIVSWDLTGNGLMHIGIVSDRPVSERPEDGFLVLHNIGGGQVLANCLFSWKIIGHYRYLGKRAAPR